MKFGLVGAAVLAFTLAGCVASPTEYVSSDNSTNKNVTINNASGYTITHFYGSNSGSNSWEEDILGTSTLASGSSINIDFEDGSGYCTFDFKIVFSDGDVGIEENIDVCTTATYTIQ